MPRYTVTYPTLSPGAYTHPTTIRATNPAQAVRKARDLDWTTEDGRLVLTLASEPQVHRMFLRGWVAVHVAGPAYDSPDADGFAA